MSTTKLIDFIVKTNYDQLPLEGIEASKDAILDCIGVALAGSKEEAGEIIFSVIKEMGGNPVAGVIGGGFRTSPYLASLANGTIAHALDYDDVLGGYGHPSVALVPTVLAVGEKCDSSGKDVITAYMVGLEVGEKIGATLGRKHYVRGWHTTSTVGTLRAVAAAAKLLKLDAQQIRMALGIAASLANGLRQNFGSMTKPFHAGSAARNGIISALLAEKGFTADENALEGPVGFFKVFGDELDYDLAEACQQLGSPFAAVSPGLWLKAYPCCAGTHATIDAALKLRREHPLDTKDIVKIECATNEEMPDVLIHHRPKKGLEGKFSLEYCVAAALLYGKVTLDHFTDEKVLADEVQNLIPKVKYSHSPELKNKIYMKLPGIVTVTLRNGEVLSSRIPLPKGTPGNPMSKEELHSKFEDCARLVLSKKKTPEVIKLVSNLERLSRLSDLMDILIGS